MARKLTGDVDALPKQLALRLSDAIVRQLERARAAFASYDGDARSISDIAREAIEGSPILKEGAVGYALNPEKRFWEIQRLASTEEIISRDLWSFLSDYAHDAYQRTQRHFVDAALLSECLKAFRDVFKELRVRGQARAVAAGGDGYFAGNFGRSGVDVLETVEDLLLKMQSTRVSAGAAEMYLRNLHVILRDEGALLPDDVLTRILRPYLAALLAVALKGYWYTEGKKPLATLGDRTLYLERFAVPPGAQNHSGEGVFFTCSHQSDEGLWAIFVERFSAFIGGDYPTFRDFAAVMVDDAQSGDYFKIYRAPGCADFDLEKLYSDIRFKVPSTVADAIRSLLRQVLADPRLASLFEALDARYGRI